MSSEDNRAGIILLDKPEETSPSFFTDSFDGIKWYILYDAFDQPAALMTHPDRKKEAIYLMMLTVEEMWQC